MTPNPRTLISNLHVQSPNGIAIVVDDACAFVLDPGGPFQPAQAAPDDSYHVTPLNIDGAPVRMEWGRLGSALVGRLTAEKDAKVRFRHDKTWPDMNTTYRPEKDGLSATAGGSNLAWQFGTDSLDTADNDGVVLSVGPAHEARFAAGLGRLPALGSVDARLDKAREKYEAERVQATGDFGDFLGAIADNLNNSRIYSSDDHRRAITVSRGWAGTVNTAPYFCWDSFFNGALACLEDPVTAKETVRAILAWQTAEGLVPNFGHWNFDMSRVSDNRSQPPVGSMCVWKIHQRRPDLAFLREAYPKLLTWHRWWPKARDGKHDGLLEWGSSKAGRQGALWETGWDDTVEFDGAEMSGFVLDAYAVDLNSLWAMDAEYLARIAEATGHRDDAKELRSERERTMALMNEKLWNEDLGVYCSRKWDGTWLTRLTPMNFYPMIAGVPDRARADRMLTLLKDPKKFWGQWLLPTVAYDDPVWHVQDYWRGKVWGPVNFLMFQGLKRYAAPADLDTFAEKSVTLFMRNWTAKGVCGENYLSSTGEQSSDPHYTWGALLCLVGLENVCDLTPDGQVRLNGAGNKELHLKNIPLGGNLYDIDASPGRAELKRGGEIVLKAVGEVVLARLPR